VLGRNDSTFIYLNLIAERSDVQLAANNTTKNITEGTTRVLLLDGEQTAIAGLISNDNQNVRRGVPFLKDLPWWFFGLRYLFGYESVSIKKRELIVLIAAKLVTPLGNRRNVRMDLQDYIDAQKREFNKVQSRGYQEGRTREAPARRPRTSQRNR
jgi:type IV pilus assembly protein PilQ